MHTWSDAHSRQVFGKQIGAVTSRKFQVLAVKAAVFAQSADL